MAGMLDQMGYALGQGARVAWFAGHFIGARRMGGPARPEGAPDFAPSAPWPDRATMLKEIRAVFEGDWANIKAGRYRAAGGLSLANALRLSRKFFADVPGFETRRKERVADAVPAGDAARYPRYYLQNFHFQKDGWLSAESAELYDFQVETLFAGTADAMRRRALVPITDALAGRDQRKLHLIDIACGTGRFLAQVKHNWPRLPVTGIDLSPAYLDEARRTLADFSATDFAEANAESLPFPDGSVDIATCVYLFHELPPKIRPVVATEIARVLKPGGLFVLADSIQTGDAPVLDALLEAFPLTFHEPYYSTYAKTDLTAMFGSVGLTPVASDRAFLTKIIAFRKS
ncbi:MAG: methyltransferase domain-containing protein [Alphaproteobacteria bacterium]|nr:methyltransferase domain-containing protein [Alphaproteobacteria bacterium]